MTNKGAGGFLQEKNRRPSQHRLGRQATLRRFALQIETTPVRFNLLAPLRELWLRMAFLTFASSIWSASSILVISPQTLIILLSSADFPGGAGKCKGSTQSSRGPCGKAWTGCDWFARLQAAGRAMPKVYNINTFACLHAWIRAWTCTTHCAAATRLAFKHGKVSHCD